MVVCSTKSITCPLVALGEVDADDELRGLEPGFFQRRLHVLNRLVPHLLTLLHRKPKHLQAKKSLSSSSTSSSAVLLYHYYIITVTTTTITIIIIIILILIPTLPSAVPTKRLVRPF
jgi:hypothetical protein